MVPKMREARMSRIAACIEVPGCDASMGSVASTDLFERAAALFRELGMTFWLDRLGLDRVGSTVV